MPLIKKKLPKVPTPKQMQAVALLNAEPWRNKKDILLECGYSLNTAKNPHSVFQSPTVYALCEQVGLTKHFVLSALKEDIEMKKGDRIGELNLASKITRLVDGDPIQHNTQINVLSEEQANEILKRFVQ